MLYNYCSCFFPLQKNYVLLHNSIEPVVLSNTIEIAHMKKKRQNDLPSTNDSFL